MTRVFVCDRHPEVRVALRQVLSESDSLSVVGEAESVEATVVGLAQCEADVVLLEVTRSGISPDRIGAIRSARPRVRIIGYLVFLTAHSRRAAMSAGMDEVVEKGRLAALVDALERHRERPG